MKRIISPSLLSANFTKLQDVIKIVEKLGVNRLHLDVMDGHFVPNITFGPFIITHIRSITDSHLETHLMINNPHNYIEDFAKAGSDTIIIHYEASQDITRDINLIRSFDKIPGIAINPDTDYKVLEPFIDKIEYILIMSVFPGFGGQSFIVETLSTMKNIVSMCKGKNILIGVDGGVNLTTINDVYSTGIDITITGSALYGAENIEQRYYDLINEK